MESPERIELVAGEQLLVEWSDGTVTELNAAQLRNACSCAECRSAAEAQRKTIRLMAPMHVTITDAHLVGSYGINFTFGPDHHRTGIFTFRQLQELAGTADTST